MLTWNNVRCYIVKLLYKLHVCIWPVFNVLLIFLSVDCGPQNLKVPELGVQERFVLQAELKVKICSPSWRLDLCCKYLTGKTREQLIKFLSAKTTSVIYGEIWGGRSSWQQPQVVTWLGILTHHFRLDSQSPQAHREQTEPRAQHVKTLTDLGDSGAHPLILCACQEKGVKISWGAGMAH